MKIFTLFGITVLILLTQSTYGQAIKSSSSIESSDENACNFSDYKPLKISHPLLKAVIKKVEPEYPRVAKSVRAEGEVVVRILVNRKGDVVGACAVEGHPLLQAASVQAAKEWKFKKDFGFVDYRFKEKFTEADLIFDFKIQ